MSTGWSRRQFIAGLGAGALVSTDIAESIRFAVNTQAIRFGYAAITWEGNDVQAIKDISELGFHGIQLRSNILKECGDIAAQLNAVKSQFGDVFDGLNVIAFPRYSRIPEADCLRIDGKAYRLGDVS